MAIGGRTLFDKIWAMHRVATIDEGTDLTLVDRVQLHERTGAVALRSLAAPGPGVTGPRPAFVTMDPAGGTPPGRTDAPMMPPGNRWEGRKRGEKGGGREKRRR